MSGWLSTRNILIAGGVVGGVYFFTPRGAPKVNPFQTQGTKNVTDAFSSGGGSTHHTPGAGTARGYPDSTAPRSEKLQGVGTPAFDDKHADQKVGQPSAAERAFRSAYLGNEKGK